MTFYDLSPIYIDPTLLEDAMSELSGTLWGYVLRERIFPVRYLVAPEARGFIGGSVIASQNVFGFVQVRKPGKLPRACFTEEYELEYGKDSLCLHKDAIKKDSGCVIFDDLLATGGTVEATIKLIKAAGGVPIAASFLVELTDLKGRERLGIPVHSLVQY